MPPLAPRAAAAAAAAAAPAASANRLFSLDHSSPTSVIRRRASRSRSAPPTLPPTAIHCQKASATDLSSIPAASSIRPPSLSAPDHNDNNMNYELSPAATGGSGRAHSPPHTVHDYPCVDLTAKQLPASSSKERRARSKRHPPSQARPCLDASPSCEDQGPRETSTAAVRFTGPAMVRHITCPPPPAERALILLTTRAAIMHLSALALALPSNAAMLGRPLHETRS
ncbi:hypothetical protein CERZMDRAFT_80689 [Cercospora zeae-maydis SCOH1-5]|uniref:Uncharacterized protein n=1 Tax=Cercospora zeae-maydis SCOH1-5 TaxID=717836 RepID=A0A6A6FXD0_9PEZI|nr:hypothetical protein CERZMDRAFT_80689 [Cercospora zeae-maydis SCOH1-5]